MKKYKNVFLLFVVICLFATIVPAFAEADTYKFAVPCPLTGDSAMFGELIHRGVDTAIEEINTAGGVNGKMLEAVYFDDKCDSTEGASVSSRIVSNKDFYAVLGHQCSGATLAGAPNYERAKIVYFSPANSRDDLTEQGFKYYFRTMTKDSGNAPVVASIAMDQLCAKKVAFIYSNDDYGVGWLEKVNEEVLRKGGEVVAAETYRNGDRDFSSQLAKIAEKSPDVLILCTGYTEAALIAIQKKGSAIADLPIVTGSNSNNPEFLELGGDAVNGVIIQVNWDRWSNDPVKKAFNDKWTELYGEPADELGPYYYEAVYLMKQAIEEGVTKDTLADYLHTVSYDGITGKIKFDEKGDVVQHGVAAITVKDGNFVSFDVNNESTCAK